ncbi:cilia- and flagella-associated protein 61 [Venturia canescens]|uniref:cilia- and flagella-associated protein 61 n=1 Tax=Venturia canescens TaxID=32260 RepID=UPI001C9C7FBE|nr:cilia- and flagella-associated protein 61 [Venturia canescens]
MANDETPQDEPVNKIEDGKVPRVAGFRPANRSDLPRICQMMGTITVDLFGDVDAGYVFEKACLSLVQVNEEERIVSNVSLCNFPNVPSVPPNDWLAWITRHYEVPGVNEKNTLFIHLLVWECRYDEEFIKMMLNDIFLSTSHCLHVIMIVPPGAKVPAVEMFNHNMKKFLPVNEKDNEMVQTLYVGLRSQEDPKLAIRRAVEEDNDDLIPIIDAESKVLREIYGDYYISEMMRYSDEGNRQMIVAESEGHATGVMCLNRVFDVDVLVENFELVPYNDLRKCAASESPDSKSSSSSRTSSSSSSDFTKTASAVMDPEAPRNRERERFSVAIAQTLRFEDEVSGEIDPEGSAQPIVKSVKFSEKWSGVNPSVNFESVLRTSVFAEAIHDLPRTFRRLK